MHIADGYLAPETVVTSYAIAIPLWVYAFKRLKKSLNEDTLPLLAAFSALSFIIMMFNIPVPGGSSAHAVGTALLAILFGPWQAFIAISLVLLIQAVVFADGGISAVAVEALGMGFIEAFVAYYIFKLLKNFKFAPFIAGYFSILAASVFIGLILGIQSYFVDSAGKPLYFPFSISVAVLAMLVGHLLIGLIEGAFTQVIYNFVKDKKALKEMV